MTILRNMVVYTRDSSGRPAAEHDRILGRLTLAGNCFTPSAILPNVAYMTGLTNIWFGGTALCSSWGGTRHHETDRGSLVAQSYEGFVK